MASEIKHTEQAHSLLPWGIYVEVVPDKDAATSELGMLVHGTPNFSGKMVYIASPDGLAPAVTGCGEKSEANAAFIVRAVNSHDALVSALANTLYHLKLFTRETDDVAKAVWDQAESALRSARGEKD